MASKFNALGDSTRLAVIERLLEKPSSVSELATPFAMALPPFMKHLRILEREGLIWSEKRGRVRICHANPDTLDDLDHWFRNRRKLWSTRLSRLDLLLKERKEDDAPAS
jgi:DNA-binding transcriptional ArsR family regulator